MFNAQNRLEKGTLESVGQMQATASPSSLFQESNAETLTQATTIATRGHCHRRWRWPVCVRPPTSLQALRGRIRRPRRYRTPIVTRRINDAAQGYPNVAAFLDSDDGFAIYRRFGWLQSILLMNKQEELRRLEQDLENVQERMNNANDAAFSSLNVRGSREDVEEYKDLLDKVETTFCSYTNLLATSREMLSFAKPAEADRQNVGMYLHNRKPLRKDECKWVQYKEDLITLKSGREDSWLDGVVESALKLFHCRLIDFVFRSDDSRKKSEIDPDVTMPARPPKNESRHEIYYTPSRIAKLMNSLHTCIILVLLIVPIYVLYHMVHDIGTREAYITGIGTLLVCTLAFSSFLSLFTQAKRHEILAAASAYCAVLVVFLGNVESSRVGAGKRN